MTVFREIVREAMFGLWRNRLRAALSMLGISWGIIAVVFLLAYGDGVSRAIDAGFKGAFGDGVTVLFPGQTSMQAGGERAGRRIRLKLADAQAAAQAPLVERWSPEFWRNLPVRWEDRQTTYLVRGVAPAYGTMRSQRAAAGRMIDAEDIRLRRRVAFIGSEVARKLFGTIPPLGETLDIQGIPFLIVGVQREKVQMSNYQRPDKESILILYPVAGQLWNTEDPDAMVFQAAGTPASVRAKAQVMELLGRRLRFNPNDPRAQFSFGSAELAEITSGIVLALNLVLGFIGVMTLAIGGVGVMNIMFVSVAERTREIGLRKALGARKRAILVQFLVEGVVTTVAGGVVGVTISALVLWALTPIPFLSELLDDASGVSDIHLLLSARLVTVTTTVLMVVGLVSGLAPAIRAAQLDPIESLRYE